MPSARGKDQIPISFWLEKELLSRIDMVRGYQQRSQFIREAIAEKLRRSGISVPHRLVYPPPRAQVVQRVGDGNPNVYLHAAAEEPGTYRVKRRRRKRKR